MKVELKKVDGKTVGWTIKGETNEEKEIVNAIRDLSFWGIDDTRIIYNGRSESPDMQGVNDAGKLHWVQEKHRNNIKEV